MSGGRLKSHGGWPDHLKGAREIPEFTSRIYVCYFFQHNADIEVFDHEDIQYGTTIGKGGEGIVQKCVVIYHDLPVNAAVKTLVDNSDDAISITLDEIELLW